MRHNIWTVVEVWTTSGDLTPEKQKINNELDGWMDTLKFIFASDATYTDKQATN